MSPLKITLAAALLTLSAHAGEFHHDSRFSPRHDARYDMKHTFHHHNGYTSGSKHHFVNAHQPHYRPQPYRVEPSRHHNAMPVVAAIGLGILIGSQIAQH